MVISWYPGHMHKASKELIKVSKQAHAMIELIDARAPLSSSNPMLSSCAPELPRIKVLTKADLADENITMQWKTHFKMAPRVSCLISENNRSISLQILVNELKSLINDSLDNTQQKQLIVVGIPNVGKSTLLNAVIGKKIAKTGDEPAITRSQQRVKIDSGWYLIDTPGLMWPKLENQDSAYKLACLGTIRNTAIDITDVGWYAAEFLFKEYPDRLKLRYGISKNTTSVETLYDSIANKIGALSKKGIPDYYKVSEVLLNDFRSGKLGRFSLEKPEI